MRIKCPNSDIVLELPNDKTDMKFTCPACHKVHRVTVVISTPGEDPPPPAAHSVMRSTTSMPKKYATGAYAPVVDIPIDANFVLIDSAASQGIDLGAAAPKAQAQRDARDARDGRDPGFSSRKTETMPREEKPAEEHELESAKKSARKSALSDSKRMMWDGMQGEEDAAQDGERRDGRPADAPQAADSADTAADDDTPATPPPTPSSQSQSQSQSQPYRDAPAPQRRREERSGGGVLKGFLFLLVLAVLGAGGYLGVQHYQYANAKKLADEFLLRADNAWRGGDIPAAAASAREAESVLDGAEQLLTPAKAYNRAAAATGLFAPLPAPEDPAAGRIAEHRARETRLKDFADSLDPSSAAGMARALRDATALAAGDTPLARAMERETVAAEMRQLDRDAPALTPEHARARARADAAALAPALSEEGARTLENGISGFLESQRRRMADEVKEEISSVAREAAEGNGDALARYRALAERLRRSGMPEFDVAPAVLADRADAPALEQLASLADLVDQAVAHARGALSREEEDGSRADELMARARTFSSPSPALADAAAGAIDDTRMAAEDLLNIRVDVYTRLQSELRRGREHAGTRLAWSMLRTAFDDPEVLVDPAAFSLDSRGASMRFTFAGLPAEMTLGEEDLGTRVRATVDGYAFTAGWALLFHRPVSWMAALAEDMRAAGVDEAVHPQWEVLEGPDGPLALSLPGAGSAGANASLSGEAAGRMLFYSGRLIPLVELPRPEGASRVDEDFRAAAQALENAVMEDSGVSQQLRQALRPVLAGTYSDPDPRDYFDSAFCRRLVEADYLESAIRPMPQNVRSALAAYRAALAALEKGYDEFRADIGEGRTLFAAVRPKEEGAGNAGDQDPETGETLPRYLWRVETDAKTVFHSPQPARFIYALMLAEEYDGRHSARPAGVPALTEVRHATRGVLASYRNGDASATGSADLWREAVAEDSSGRFDPSAGEPGWNYPLHVLQRDDQGDPVLLATLSGIVRSPDFSGVVDDEARRRAEDEWLTDTARTLSTPGELGLIFHQFFRYCSDSPLPELPSIIGSHVGLSDTHQTVYESLERRWVGRLIGDCDDLAEFFQILTRRQGRLSHVMQLPGHAAAGYVERVPLEEGDENGDGEEDYRFIVLQTGPVLQFTAGSLNEVVEMAYRSFDRGEGVSHMTTDAVPLLLRFADEETRTPFVLSARIFEDAEYADTMIRVQSYWHEHVFSAAIETMEKLVDEDKEIGNIKELGSLYERVGFYDRSEELRRSELEMVKDNPNASLSTLLEIVQLHFQSKNRAKALEALGEMEEIMMRMIRNEDAPEFFRNMTFRSYWAIFLSRLGDPGRAWNLVRYDVAMTKRQLGRIAEPVLRTLVVMYERMCLQRDRNELAPGATGAMAEVRVELEEAFHRGYFTADDSYNAVIGKYFFLGRFAVADRGRDDGLAELRKDGPYPENPKNHTDRRREVSGADWGWFRITPQLYHVMGVEMLDDAEYPELYDPDAARPLLQDVARAVERGTGLGADVAGKDDVVTAALTLSFLNGSLEEFRSAMATVKEKNYSSLYDDAALTFGQYCGLVPLAEFGAWTEAFHEFFPGRQHYFKVVYRAIDKEHYDHALAMAEATARFFPDQPMLLREAEFVRSIIPDLKNNRARRQWMQN